MIRKKQVRVEFLFSGWFEAESNLADKITEICETYKEYTLNEWKLVQSRDNQVVGAFLEFNKNIN